MAETASGVGKRKAVVDTSAEAKEKLLDAAIELFGSHGYEGTSLRAVEQKVKQGTGSITHHFGDKQGLYAAAAEAVTSDLQQTVAPPLEEIERELDGGKLTSKEQLACMQRLLSALAIRLAQGDAKSRCAAQIFLHEQQATTTARPLHQQVYTPIQKACCRLLGRYLGKNPENKDIILHSYMLVGMAMSFHATRDMLLSSTQWETIGDAENQYISAVLAEHTQLVLHGLREKLEAHQF